MSDRENVSTETQREPVAQRTVNKQEMVTPVAFSFSKQCWKQGLQLSLAATVSLGLGMFLFSQMDEATALQWQLLLIGIILLSVGVGCGYMAARYLFGKLVIDQSGIYVWPEWSGQHIQWESLDRWEFLPSESRHSDEQFLHLWGQVDSEVRTIPLAWLKLSDRTRLYKTLRAHAAEKEALAF